MLYHSFNMERHVRPVLRRIMISFRHGKVGVPETPRWEYLLAVGNSGLELRGGGSPVEMIIWELFSMKMAVEMGRWGLWGFQVL